MSDQSDTDAASDGSSDPTGDEGRAGGGLWSPDRGSLPLRRLFDVLLVVALVAVVVPFAVYAAPSLIGAEESYVVRSGSMAPAIGTGDVVIVERATPAEIETGDVITFVPDGQPPPTTHRVVARTEEDGVIRFTTKGDANDQPDAEPVVGDEIVGRVTLVLPYVGYIVSFASTSAGFFALVAAPFGLLLATEVWRLFREADGDGRDSSGADDVGGAGDAPELSPDAAAGTTEDETAYTLSPTDIRLSLAILLALTVYSSSVAVSRPTPWSIAVAVAAFGTTIYLAAMRYTAVTAGTSTPERPMSPLPPAREVAPPDEGRAGVGPVTVGEGPASNGTLEVSLAVSPSTPLSEDPDPAASAEPLTEPASEDRSVATDEAVSRKAATDEARAGDDAGPDAGDDAGPATDDRSDRSFPGADSSDTEPGGGASESRGIGRRLRVPIAVVGGAVYRFLYAVGYLEVAAVRGVLRRLGLRSDGGED